MADFRVPSTCDSIRMDDGTVYRSDNGRVRVNERHAREIEGSYAAKTLDMIMPVRSGKADANPTNMCPRCCFNAYDFSKVCPRCGEDLTTKEGESK